MLTRARIERQEMIELIARDVAQNFTGSMSGVVAWCSWHTGTCPRWDSRCWSISMSFSSVDDDGEVRGERIEGGEYKLQSEKYV